VTHTDDNRPDGPDLAQGRITGPAVDWTATFTPTHRAGNPTPARLTCTITMPLSLDDAAAAVWAASDVGVLQGDVTELDDLHAVVVFMLVNHNREVAAARKRLTAPLLGSPEFEEVTLARAVANRLYGNHPANRARFGDRAGDRPDRPLRAVRDQPADPDQTD
jgi:hypothetical protein